ncbi:MBL fold metallo-hydrolase [Bacillota bacterium Meth-B3]|nr:MBL fold metallo-hydrolase [Christensenellaceae bacterium]MEA5067807.1 MBL fold metallo-hydrolase [Christensenellaceae bacterium]
MARITYHGHSGFSVRTAQRLLVFDYLGTGLDDPEPLDRAIAFISHAHSDHNHPIVQGWARQGLCHLAEGYDVHGAGYAMRPGDSTVIEGAIVRAFGSTDQGVSFWVESNALKVLHAGDFNLWHWRGEANADWTRKAERAFEAILKTMEGLPVDVAFFPVDPRMGENADEGALRFAERIRPKLIIPMHFWDQPRFAERFAEQKMPEGTRAVALTEPGASIEL